MTSPRFLTSWREIAQYLGKSVRTAQRWEERYGLPVRRPGDDNVLIEVEELNRWVRVAFADHKASGPQINWELLERSRRLIEEGTLLREKHSSLILENRDIRSKLREAVVSVTPAVSELEGVSLNSSGGAAPPPPGNRRGSSDS